MLPDLICSFSADLHLDSLNANLRADHALHLAPWSAELWSQRAEVLLVRGWKGVGLLLSWCSVFRCEV
jgi:hypothetical protein